jgi:uncharacterized protein
MDYPQYNPQTDNLPLSDDELNALDDLLQELPSDEAMNIECMDGYLTALLVGPGELSQRPGAEWLPAVWGGDGEGNAPFPSNKQRKRATLLVLRHLQSIAVELREKGEAWQPVFSVAEVDGQDLVDAEVWCIGFLQAVALNPEAWSPLFDDADLGAALVPIALLGGDEEALSAEDAQRLNDLDMRDQLSRAVVDAVVLLHERKHGVADAG